MVVYDHANKAQLLHTVEGLHQNWALTHPLVLQYTSNTAIIIDAMVAVQEQVVFKTHIINCEEL